MESDTDTDADTSIDNVWVVIVLDDPINTMTDVTRIFQRVLNVTAERAHQFMLEVHTRGRSQVFTGSKDEAAGIYAQLTDETLTCLLEER
jgi:ATP-dependent Clp protease adaptor protein ClpS